MKILSTSNHVAKKVKPILIIHGGAGFRKLSEKTQAKLHCALKSVLDNAYASLLRTGSAEEAVIHAVQMLEDNPLFNAGRGSKRQSDGKIRMSAGLMNGAKLRFSGVVNVTGLRNPIHLARELSREKDRTLATSGATRFAKKLGLAFRSPYTVRSTPIEIGKTGTVGAVALDSKGHIASATSTGGKGGERVGRVSDSPTVAGNYANEFAGVSATGVGEEIVECALAASIVTRVEDNRSLQSAFQKTFQRAKKRRFQLGCIGLSRKGEFCAMTTTPFLAWAVKTPTQEIIEPCPSSLS